MTNLGRRAFLARAGFGLGAFALGDLMSSNAHAGGLPGLPHFAPKAKRVISLFQSGGPSHLELFDPKPQLDRLFDKDLPPSVRGNQRITGMVAGQARLALQPSRYGFSRCGQSGVELGDLIPHTQKIADRICLIRSMNTEAINHDPAITFMQTGSQQPGRPSQGAWVTYGLGSENRELPAFVVMVSVPSKGTADQGLLSRLWSAGFMPGQYQGVQLRGGADPVPYLQDPPGFSRAQRRVFVDAVRAEDALTRTRTGDEDVAARIAQYEMAFRMQSSVPDLTDLSKEPASTFALYGEEARKPGTFARHCLLARRMAERGVRFIQLYHRGWDTHVGTTDRLPVLCRDTDQASAALVEDLARRGLLEDTLVVWGGEFGRTCYAQGNARRDGYGRDHHGRAFSMWLAGGGIKAGLVHGASDDFGFNLTENPVHVHDLQATLLHCLGIDHQRLTYRHQGRQFRLTDVHGQVVRALLA